MLNLDYKLMNTATLSDKINLGEPVRYQDE